MKVSRRVAHPTIILATPIVGVTLFGWELASILVFYWVDLGVTIVRQCVEGAFAARPNSEQARVLRPPFRKLRDKRGTVTTRLPTPPVYVRAIPSIVVGASGSLPIWGAIGICLFYVNGNSDIVSFVLSPVSEGLQFDSKLLFGVVSTVLGQIVTLSLNVRERDYQTLSPRAVIGPRQAFAPILFFLCVVVSVILAGEDLTAARAPVFVVVVVGRACVDAADEFGVIERYLPGGVHTLVGKPDPVSTGTGTPHEVWKVDRGSVVFLKMVVAPNPVFRDPNWVVHSLCLWVYVVLVR
ncbi:MAG: hypothetical protein J07HB67_02852 [halophilic archaeon J07HB67]|jgi:hypothetical protein|nr:MAG: hypothetical protein J07HB67_02852 [halophilic archaeon J07HB67]